MVAFYSQLGTAAQHIKEGKNAINWTRLSCHGFRNNEVRLQLHALAYNLGNFMRTVKGGEKPDQRAEQNTATVAVGVRWSEGVGIRLGAAGAGNAGRA